MRNADVSATHVHFTAALKQNLYFHYGIRMLSQYVVAYPCSCLSSKDVTHPSDFDAKDMYQYLLKHVQIFNQNLSKPQK